VTATNVRTLPKYHPSKKLLKNPMSMKTLGDVINRLQQCIRSMSIQASYTNSPLSAKLQTPENCEFYLDFWKSSTGNEFYIDIQRRRGDHLIANMYIRKLLDAAKEFDENDYTSERSFNNQQMQSLESFLKKAMKNSDWMPPQSPEDATKIAMENIHSSLMSKRLDARKNGLKQLVGMTDLHRTMSPAACSASMVVLAGKPKAPDFADKAMDIHEAIIRLIQSKEFEGDDQLFASSGVDMDLADVEPFFQNDTMSRNRPRYYEELMNEFHQLALTILVQVLEVASCFEDQFSQVVRYFVEKYVTTQGMDITLKECIAKVKGPPASLSLSTGYLACKALRILAKSDDYLRKCVEEDARLMSWLSRQ
jgi:hypothetical protein